MVMFCGRAVVVMFLDDGLSVAVGALSQPWSVRLASALLQRRAARSLARLARGPRRPHVRPASAPAIELRKRATAARRPIEPKKKHPQPSPHRRDSTLLGARPQPPAPRRRARDPRRTREIFLRCGRPSSHLHRSRRTRTHPPHLHARSPTAHARAGSAMVRAPRPPTPAPYARAPRSTARRRTAPPCRAPALSDCGSPDCHP